MKIIRTIVFTLLIIAVLVFLIARRMKEETAGPRKQGLVHSLAM